MINHINIIGDKMNKEKSLKEVPECYNQAEAYQCIRCKDDTDTDGWYCDNCNPPQKVNFDIIEDGINWNGKEVCPYCYNQLLKKK